MGSYPPQIFLYNSSLDYPELRISLIQLILTLNRQETPGRRAILPKKYLEGDIKNQYINICLLLI